MSNHIPIEALSATDSDAQYLGNVAEFRAEVFSKLYDLGSLSLGRGWAVFYSDMGVSGDVLEQRQEMALLVTRKQGVRDHNTPSDIRILSQQLYPTESGGSYYLEDIHVDSYGDSQYAVHSFDFKNTDSEMPIGDTPFFWVDDQHGLQAPNAKGFPLIHRVRDRRITEDPALPFGHRANLTDRANALGKAQEVFVACNGLLPVYVSAEFNK